jgi:hypothetical protein
MYFPKRVFLRTNRALTNYFVVGTDSRRAIYAGFKRMYNYQDSSLRARFARQLADQASFNIPVEQGFVVFGPGRFRETGDVVQASQSLINHVEPEKLKGQKKHQLRTDLLDMSQLTLNSPYLRFALRPDIIASVSRYLGMLPILARVDVWYSQHTDKDFGNSQLFHCDGIDTTQVKVFVCSTKTSVANGPLVVMGAKTSKVLRDKLRYTYGGQRVADQEVISLVGSDDQHPILGPVGTVAFVDSCRCFHYGSRVSRDAAARIVTVIQFITPCAVTLPLNYRKVTPFKHLVTPQSSMIHRLVLGC